MPIATARSLIGSRYSPRSSRRARSRDALFKRSSKLEKSRYSHRRSSSTTIHETPGPGRWQRDISGTLLEADLVRAALRPLFLIGLAIIFYLGKNRIGRLFMLIGVLHVGGGLIVGREPIARILREGFLSEADSALGNMAEHAHKELAFWFILWGVYTFLLGQLASWMEREGKRFPPHVGWQLIVINLVAAALIPKGGFWLFLVPSFMILRDAGRPSTR